MFNQSQERLQELRSKSREAVLSLEEVREAIKLMRGDRERAAAVSATSKARKAPTAATADLLSELEGL
jgi:DNA-binding transcriptional MerR regulator